MRCPQMTPALPTSKDKQVRSVRSTAKLHKTSQLTTNCTMLTSRQACREAEQGRRSGAGGQLATLDALPHHAAHSEQVGGKAAHGDTTRCAMIWLLCGKMRGGALP